ncbi:hypothetical protein RSOLAG22IIIB_05759 [Rhizoctonia solani]|uniref:Uncharacterized protein n=1 Tax=Rhizoctonia solani TaxID=456999 RepID=A0A0K6G9Z8_9AGAM|nr:hypothetical protein RSOLAG22IIIB_05759 [Rhizoctonia solani]
MSQYYILSGRPVPGKNQAPAVRDALSNATSRKQRRKKGKGGLAEMTTLEFVGSSREPCGERTDDRRSTPSN